MRRINTSALLIAIASSMCVGCYGEMVVGDDEGPWVTCTNGRLVTFVIDGAEFSGMHEATSDTHGGYVLYAPRRFANAKLTRVEANGNLGETLPIPSELGPYVSDLVPTADGGILLSGTVGLSSGSAPWVGKVDAEWELAWESTLDESAEPMDSADDVVVLPDGGAIVAGVIQPDTGSNPTGLSWARLDDSGNVVWERALSLPGLLDRGWWGKMLAVHPEGFRMVAATDQGIQLIESTLDGEWTRRLLEPKLALHISDIAGLPDGRLVIASSRSLGAVLTMVAADGTVEWEKLFGEYEYAEGSAVAYNAGRNELLLGGAYRGSDGGTQRTWIIATDLKGDQTWELVRTPADHHLDGHLLSIRDDQGPGITDIAVRPDGSFIATGSSTNLSYFVVSADDCSDGGG